MLKTVKKENPYKKIRKEVPPPGHAINGKNVYDRGKYKKEIVNIIEEELESCEPDIATLCEDYLRKIK